LERLGAPTYALLVWLMNNNQWGAKQDGRELDLFGEPDHGKPVTGTHEQPSLFDNMANPKVATNEGSKENE